VPKQSWFSSLVTRTAAVLASLAAVTLLIYAEREATNIKAAEALLQAKMSELDNEKLLRDAETRRADDLERQLQAANSAQSMESIRAQQEALKQAQSQYLEAATKASQCETNARADALKATDQIADLRSQLLRAKRACAPKGPGPAEKE
jgi:hypothetical protein